MRSFAAQTLDSLPEHFVGLPVIGTQFISEILPRLHFGLFHRGGCWLSLLSLLWIQRRVGFHQVVIFCSYSPHRVVSVRIPEQHMKLQLLWTVTTPPPHLLCIPRAIGTRTIRCLHLCPSGSHSLWGRPS